MKQEELRVKVKEAVTASLHRQLEEATAQRLSIFENKDESNEDESADKNVNEAEKNDEGSDDDENSDENSEEDDSDSDDDEEDDDQLDEALTVVAMPASERKHGAHGKTEKLTIKNIRELTKLAKTGQYDYFTVTKGNGDEDEYHVDKGELVLM